MTRDTSDTNVLSPRPHASGGVPTPREVTERLVGSPTALVALLTAVFGLITASYLYIHRSSLPPEWAAVGGALVTLAFIITRLPKEYSSVLQALPALSEVYLAERYAQLATRIFYLTLSGMVVLVALLTVFSTGWFRDLGLNVGIVSATTQTIVTAGVTICLLCSFALIRALLCHAPPFNRSAVLTAVERSTLPEIVYGLALFGCPAMVVAAKFIWVRPELYTLPVTLSTIGTLILIGGFTTVYAAIISRA